MKTEDVKQLPPLERFLYWIRERHGIYRRRLNAQPKPWTDDEVLQNFFFTNPYRENDKVTVWFKEQIRDPLRNSTHVIFATIAFRWFNLPETAVTLMGSEGLLGKDCLLTNWCPAIALGRLNQVRRAGKQVFTGAYMINSPGGEPKLEAILRRVSNVWDARQKLMDFFVLPLCFGNDNSRTMEEGHKELLQFDGIGGFMAYEVICDLRYTCWLEHATDKDTWCNPGPGCIRGLYRLMELPFDKGNNSSAPPAPKNWQQYMWGLLLKVKTKFPGMPRFEMREIEHSLCEFDKYERLLWGDGKAKRRYKGI